ncbi:acyl carrier protein [Roseomonas sp. M0104]|uniref:Acyl carrier protein n=1 Tax=Teichococcus coralli TaxID=2545983 RepID=A0A845BBL7_9PROT|nr:acyl carrier protein [Pseudoroseomonas coralli]
MFRGPAPVQARRFCVSSQLAIEAEVAALIVEALHLETSADQIDPEAPLFGEGLGLDSIDALEIALAISRRYGFQLRSDDERNGQIFASLRNLSAHIEKHRQH